MVLLPQIFGPGGLLSSFFLNPQNMLLALALLIPLILLYLIKPKPVNVAVPSLMFILNDMGRSNVRRFFRSLFRDILFIIQAIIIILLGMTLAKPFIEVNQESLVQQSVLIIDTSASTRAADDARFEKIQELALDELAPSNVIIVSRQNPVLLKEGAEDKLSASEAKDLIEDLRPTDMDGDLPGALDMAAQYAGQGTKVSILSDLVLSRMENPDLIEAKLKVLRSKGAIIRIVKVDGGEKNIGIIGATVNSRNATIDVKIQNFNPKPEEFGLEYNGKKIDIPRNILEGEGKSGSLIVVSVPIAYGVSELRLTPDDDFDLDNHYYISTPQRESVEILLISNDGAVQQSKLVPALKSAGDQVTKVNIAFAAPPRIPDLQHQVYVIKDVSTEFILPGVVRDLQNRVENGAVLIIYGQESVFNMGLRELLPVTYKQQATPLPSRVEIVVNTSAGLMKGLSDLGQVDGKLLMRVQKTNDSVVDAYVMTNEGPEPVIAHRRVGKGVVLYYGIKDQRAIDIDPQSYAVIWGRIVDYSIPDLRNLNVPTGALLSSPSKTIQTPNGKQTSPTLASRSGIYQAGTVSVAANLYALQTTRTLEDSANTRYESFITKSVNLSETGTAKAADEEEVKLPKDLSNIVIFVVIGIMLFELIYVKLRGDF